MPCKNATTAGRGNEDDRLAGRRLARHQPRLDGCDGGRRLGVLLIDQIVERSQHEVQQRHIAANRGGE
jgi:hypothetical protein